VFSTGITIFYIRFEYWAVSSPVFYVNLLNSFSYTKKAI